MRKTVWIWTGLCAAVVVIAFFGTPGWDTDTEGWELFSGAEVFYALTFVVGVVWLVGLGAVAAIIALVKFLGRDGGVRAWWSRRGISAKAAIVALLATSGVAIVSAAARIPGEGSEASDFVVFDTVDADPDWSPNGRLIAFTTSRASGGVYVVRPDGTAMRRVFRGEASDVDWSPDGQSLVFVGERGIYVMRLRESRPKLVLRGSRFSLPAWAPNGRELAVATEESGVYRSYDGPIEGTSAAIYVVRPDGTGLRRLLPRYRGAAGGARPGSIAAVSETEPAWSPDGKRIAFQASDGEIVSADVRTGRRVTINEARAGYEPAWSPDGRLIAYQCEGDLCVANADGSGDERRVASDGGDPSWSADSRLLVFEHYLYGGSVYGSSPQSLSIVDANGGGLRKLTFGASS
jgi:Tol biopolymer transport system component